MRGPTQRSLNLLRERGYTVYVVEHFNAFAKVRRDLFGFIDIVALHPDKKGILGIQTTTSSNLAARITKAQALPAYSLWLDAGNVVEFHGWRKIGPRGKRKLWQPNIRTIFRGPADRLPPGSLEFPPKKTPIHTGDTDIFS